MLKIQIIQENAMVTHMNFIICENVRMVFGMDCIRFKKNRFYFNEECERQINQTPGCPSFCRCIGYVRYTHLLDTIVRTCKSLNATRGLQIEDGHNCIVVAGIFQNLLLSSRNNGM